MIISPRTLDAIEQRAAKATAGPWYVRSCDDSFSVCADLGAPSARHDEEIAALIQVEGDAVFIAHVREDVTVLCTALRVAFDQFEADRIAIIDLEAEISRCHNRLGGR